MAVSQATFLRRCHVKGELWLFNFHFEMPSPAVASWPTLRFDTQVISAVPATIPDPQSTLTKWIGAFGTWCSSATNSPRQTRGPERHTVVEKTPIIREKPYLVVDGSGNYTWKVPALKKD